MNRLILIAALSAFAVGPVSADLHGAGWDGGTASWTRVYYQGQGGEFTLYPSTAGSLLLSNAEYAPSTRGQDGRPQSFQSFCLETDEYVASNMRIWVSESSVNEATGVAEGTGSHAWQGGANTNLGDNLDPMTTYYYTQFAMGQLPGYAYTGTVGGLNRSETAGALQRLIWATEGEGGSNFSVSFMGISLNDAQRALIDQWSNAWRSSGWEGIGDVRVLQLYYGGTGCNPEFKQDQLFLTPTPVPGAVLLGFLGLGAAGLKLRRFA